ncbi:D-alanyl-D-alanine carboxypeptidase/D-alanyl-D-alanine endopeptidase [Pararhodobacter zhoushanensis]|uniref:D-alanyl-D-alanine carboxypeptidase/D-alanyl-D-alanine-endopeptidase n=1 Tax=Pararhodobacter zhoushanensis TaxID=2479545 RepID=A0ABT3GY68_9RHOB|nr:D-alanyl-D-alanine carboxypeptidase/D-alanyl-D-alanine-endopeptidase [Pararhodobacter zhoushanensis]MCW1932443.1 D-alanyl-D-alanine carboxypeptidase/D-alanyl-D-alanine-endopeptidase [Pararhodobacter zhoushanensis]
MFCDRTELSRRALLAGAFASLAVPAMASAPTRSPRPPARPAPGHIAALSGEPAALVAPSGSLSSLIERANLSGETAMVALDAETGAVIEEHRADLRMPPASTAKAVTTLYALQTLGAEYRFITRVESRGGAIANGTLSGDLVLRGGGDPTLQTAELARLADELIERGLRRIDGRFLVDDSALPDVHQIDNGQPVPAGYNPAIGGLNLNFNRVYFGWEVANGRAALSMDARSNTEVPGVSMIDIEAVARSMPVYTHDVRGEREHWTVAANALGTPGSRWLPVRRPGAYAGDVFRALLAARGCQLPEPRRATVAPGQVLAEHRSDPLTSILREMLRYSTNITAECVGMTASQRLGPGVQALAPSASRMNGWIRERYGAAGLGLLDHSGLSEGSRIAPRTMAQYLLAARREGVLPGLLREHPLRDANGREIASHPVEVRAKTGTLNFVSALAGYAQLRGGRAVVFSIVSADLPRRAALSDDTRERPVGARSWSGRARALQQDVIERWSAMHS